MGNITVTFQTKTLNELNALRDDFEKSRNISGILRIIAITAIAAGDSIQKVADLMRTCSETIKNWVDEFLWMGILSLTPVKSTGRPKTLNDSEEEMIKKILAKTPEECGFRGGCWDSKKVGKFIKENFGKTVSIKYIPEILKNLGFSFKKARVSAGDKNAWLRKQWIEYTWPKILGIAEKQDAHIFFGDEAYFSIFGTTSYTWTLTNTEAVIESTGSKENLHIIGAINFHTGKTHALMTDGKVNEDVFICYLETLLKETRKHIHLIVDNARYHKSAKIKEFLIKMSIRLTIHYLPPYSPDYNPIEGFWKKLKKETTHNVYFESSEALWEALIKGLKYFRDNPAEVKALFGFYENLA
jgi:transposase